MKVLVAIPTYDGNNNYGVTKRILDAGRRDLTITFTSRQSSFLTLGFNEFWCMALNDRRYDYLVMLHADLPPNTDRWVSMLIKTCESVHADVLSVVSPLKMETGATSTALTRERVFGHHRRLTLKEVYKLPETFNAEHAAKLFGWSGDTTLLVNTGCMVVSMKKRATLETMLFTTNNWIFKDPDGKFRAVSEAEDWNWSVQAKDRGLSVWATRAIPLVHVGTKEYSNESAWGDEHDEGF